MKQFFNLIVENNAKTKKILGFSALIAFILLIILEIAPLNNIFFTIVRWILRVATGCSISLFLALDEQGLIKRGVLTLSNVKKRGMIFSVVALFFGIIFFFLTTVVGKYTTPYNFKLLSVYIGICTSLYWTTFIWGGTHLIISIYLQIKYKDGEDELTRKFTLYVLVPVLCFVTTFMLPLVFSTLEGRGNGVTTCKNCGHGGIAFQGMCEDCADLFLKWHNNLD